MSDPFSIWARTWADSVAHLGAMLDAAARDELDPATLRDHVEQCTDRGLGTVRALVDWWLDQLTPDGSHESASGPAPGDMRTMRVPVPDQMRTAGPVQVRVSGLRVHGGGDAVVVPATALQVDTAKLGSGELTVSVTLPTTPEAVIFVGDVYLDTLDPNTRAVIGSYRLTTVRFPHFPSAPAP